jgi:uncharacterized protein Yka (UPF0111/DUF47 family)
VNETKEKAVEELNKELERGRNRERDFFTRLSTLERETDLLKDENRRVKKDAD